MSAWVPMAIDAQGLTCISAGVRNCPGLCVREPTPHLQVGPKTYGPSRNSIASQNKVTSIRAKNRHGDTSPFTGGLLRGREGRGGVGGKCNEGGRKKTERGMESIEVSQRRRKERQTE
jgi:hypothetical protein